MHGITEAESFHVEGLPFELSKDGKPKLPDDFEGVIFSGLCKSYPSLKPCDYESGYCPTPYLPEMKQLEMRTKTKTDQADALWD